MDEAGVDFAFVAWHEDGRWNVEQVPEGPADTLAGLVTFARQRQGYSGSVAFISVAEEFFVCLRVAGARVRVLLSDVCASLDWPIAEEAADLLGLDLDVVEEVEELEPAGDLKLLADLGMGPADLDHLCGDPELYPDEQIAAIAEKIGFHNDLANLLDVVQS